jgi:hypothetical protein
VKLLEALGQHKTARRLKYGECCCLRGCEPDYMLSSMDRQSVTRTTPGLRALAAPQAVLPVCATLPHLFSAGHMCWAIQNNAKTDRNLFFGSRNLKALATQLSEADQGEWTVSQPVNLTAEHSQAVHIVGRRSEGTQHGCLCQAAAG